MEVNNHTSFPHLLFRSGLEDNKMAAAIMVRVSYDIIKGEAVPSENQDWPLSAGPWQSRYGPMEGDFVFKRGGVDLLIFGSAVAPNNQATKRMEVSISIPGKLNHTIAVFGDRTWKSGILGPSISDPKPFTEMELSLQNAYGGWDEWDSLKFPYSNNPHGKGFIWQKENAIGRPLPNIEDPNNLISGWNDRPHPVGLTAAPMCENRVKKAVEFDQEGNLTKFDPLFFNAAFPELVVNQVTPGEVITVSGVTKTGIFKFTVPEHKIPINLIFDEQLYERDLYIDQIGLEPGSNRAFITYRYPFTYVLKKMTKRIINILN
jgi:hypothetical protein